MQLKLDSCVLKNSGCYFSREIAF